MCANVFQEHNLKQTIYALLKIGVTFKNEISNHISEPIIKPAHWLLLHFWTSWQSLV